MANARAESQYDVAIDRALSAVTIDACLGPLVSNVLTLSSAVPPAAVVGLKALPHDEGANSGERRYSVVPARDHCVHYALDLKQLPDGDPNSDFQRLPEAILIDPAMLFVLPEGAGEERLALTLALPATFALSAPGSVERAHETVWRATLTTRAWRQGGRIAIGHFISAQARIGDAELTIAVLSGRENATTGRYIDWVRAAAQALGGLYGRFPVPDLQVIVVPTSGASAVVPWGDVMRSSADAVVVFVDQTRTVSELRADGRLLQLLSHLLYPALESDADWLSDGLAAYYRIVLQAQARSMPADRVWTELEAGFARGRYETDGRTTLAAATMPMRQRRLVMRVVWSGAAFALAADTELRLRTQNRRSLAQVLGDFRACCLPANRRWTAQELLQKFDALAGIAVFATLANEMLASPEFPDLSAVYGALGLDLAHDTGKVKLIDAPAPARLRTAIIAPLTR